MLGYIARRLLETVPVLLGVTVVVFLFLHLIPGDPAEVLLGERATAERIARLRGLWGLDQPLPVQYARYVGRLVQGDFGRSIHTNRPVLQEAGMRFPATLELAAAALLISTAVGVLAGMISATRRDTLIDHGVRVLSLGGISMPIFWLGLVLIWIFGVQLQWLPPGGRLDATFGYKSATNFVLIETLVQRNWPVLRDAAVHLVLPALALSTIPMAIIARMTRSALLEVLRQDYVRTARAKGLSEARVTLGHALKNASLPLVTVVGLQVGLLLSGAVITETIFSWPGVGRWIFDSILTRDYPIVQGMSLLVALIFVGVNLLVDLSYAVLDPRIRY